MANNAPVPTERNPVQEAWREIERSVRQAPEIELTILMPCLDEAETLGLCIDQAQAFLQRTRIAGEVVIADNGSSDGSPEIARSLGARVVRITERGYGAALIGGIQAARGRYVIMGDADASYDFGNLDEFVARLRDGFDLVMGNRFKGGIARAAMPKLHRYLGNPILSFVGRLFFRSPIGDFHCGLRGFSRDAIRRLRLSASGMEFASEMVVKATVERLRITEAPTTLSPDGRSRPPHLRSWRDGWRHLKLLLTFAPDWLFLYPGGALAGMGLFTCALLMPGPLPLGAVTLDNATLVFAMAAVLVGAQMLMFYAVARAHAVAEGMLPASRREEWLRAGLTVDRLCLAGGILFLAGLIVAVASVMRWVDSGLGPLEASVIIRFAVLATLAMALGVQLVTGGFLLALVRRRSAAPRVSTALDAPLSETADTPAARSAA